MSQSAAEKGFSSSLHREGDSIDYSKEFSQRNPSRNRSRQPAISHNTPDTHPRLGYNAKKIAPIHRVPAIP